jgi:hypothetical protein
VGADDIMKSEMPARMIRDTFYASARGKCAYLLDCTTRKADNKRAPTPCNAPERIYRTHQYSGASAHLLPPSC